MVKNEKGFTLVEMLIVMLVVSILLIITIPNVARTNEKIQSKGCEAYIQMIQSQVQLYELQENKKVVDLKELVPEYIPENSDKCPNGKKIVIEDSVVKVESGEQDDNPNDVAGAGDDGTGAE